ncbi:UNVERIFIED_CONTAM: hypothetical protein GTU68_008785 [Idotea baltica]|nr:hypothetical protein [Idotea baltica]
MSVLQKGN